MLSYRSSNREQYFRKYLMRKNIGTRINNNIKTNIRVLNFLNMLSSDKFGEICANIQSVGIMLKFDRLIIKL